MRKREQGSCKTAAGTAKRGMRAKSIWRHRTGRDIKRTGDDSGNKDLERHCRGDGNKTNDSGQAPARGKQSVRRREEKPIRESDRFHAERTVWNKKTGGNGKTGRNRTTRWNLETRIPAAASRTGCGGAQHGQGSAGKSGTCPGFQSCRSGQSSPAGSRRRNCAKQEPPTKCHCIAASALQARGVRTSGGR